MNPGKNMFDPFGLMAGGPFAAWQQSWQVGWRLLENWQRVWLPLLQPALPMAGLPALPFGPLAGLVKSMTGMFPFGAVLPQVEANLTPIRGAAGEGEAARLSMRVGLPGAADERLSIEALIARRQGRDSPQLGCLQGAQVVYPAVDETSPATATVIDAAPVTVTRQVAMAAKPAARKPAKKTTIAAPAAMDTAAAKAAVAAKPRARRTKPPGKK